MATGFGSFVDERTGQLVTFFQDSFGPPGEDWGYRYGAWLCEMQEKADEQRRLDYEMLHTANDPNRIDSRNVRREFGEPRYACQSHYRR